MAYNIHLHRASLLLVQSCRQRGASSCLSNVPILNQRGCRQLHVCTTYVNPLSWRNRGYINRDDFGYRDKMQQRNVYRNLLCMRALHTGLVLNDGAETVPSSEHLIQEITTSSLLDNGLKSSPGETITESVTDCSAPVEISVASEVPSNLNEIETEPIAVATEVSTESIQVAPVTSDVVEGMATNSFPETVAQISTSGVENPFVDAQSIVGLTNAYDGTIASLGLGSWSTPVGWIQNVLETIHLGIGLPWWGSIVCCTVLFRVLVFPLAVKGIINNLKMQAIKPEMDRLQAIMKSNKAMHEPRVMGKARFDMQLLFKKHGTNPLKGLITPLVQGPLFVSFFLAIRRMSEAPVPSFMDGGALWFTDLTLQDPYYLLPCISASILLLTVEMGQTEMGPLGDNMKWFGRIMALIIIPITLRFPAATLMYWVTTNSFTCIQSYALRQPATKQFLGIPAPISPASGGPFGGGATAKGNQPKKSFKESMMSFYEPIYKQAEAKYEAKRQEQERKDKLLNPPLAKDLYLKDPTLKVEPNKGKKVRRKHR